MSENVGAHPFEDPEAMTAEAVLPFDALVVEEPDFSAKPLHRHPAGKTSDSVGYGNLSDKINENNFKGSSPKKAYPKIGTSEFEAFSRSLDKRPLRYRVVKRIFDIVFSLVIIFVCIFCWPITLALLMTIAVQTKGFPFYVQERVGLHGKPIKICKLRSMVRDSDNIEKYLQEEMLEQWHKERKVDNDPRIVPVGHFIRKTSIDEFANVFNVLLGQIPLRILKTRRGFSVKMLGAFALPARLARTRIAAFLQVRGAIYAIVGVPQNLFEYSIAGYGKMRGIFAKRDSRIEFPLLGRFMLVPCNGFPI